MHSKKRSLAAARLGWGLVTLIAAGLVGAEEGDAPATPQTALDELLEYIKGGKPIVDINLRWEYGKIDDQKVAHAATARTRIGYQTKPLAGVSGLMEMINVVSPKPSGYYDGTGANQQNRTIVADVETTDVNRAWLGIDRPDWLGSGLKGGRQRIVFDDSRWVGNVPWRQIGQRFDAASGHTSFGVEGLDVRYAFTWNVKRIYGDKGSNVANRDYEQTTHFVNASYVPSEALQAVAFAYLIDPSNLDNGTDARALNHTMTYGLRLTGRVDLSERLGAHYELSYAYQEDWRDNPVDYEAHYYKLVSGLTCEDVAGVELGYEVLGSDDGKAVVATPFATAHKFNGFADAFLNNGGPRGLRDVFVSVSPAIPVDGLELSLIFHQFYSDQGSDDYGQEYDAVATYDVNAYLQLLYKVGYYDERNDRSPASRVRSILQTTFKF